mgnify:CR=1 FL=1
MSVKIRERVKAAKQRFHANDNIAAFIQPGELEALLDEVEDKMKLVLDSFDGSQAMAAAAYNAGPGRVRTLGRIPPFRETIDYVAAITKGWSSGAYRAASVQTAEMHSAAGWRGRGVQLLAYTSTSVPNPR